MNKKSLKILYYEPSPGFGGSGSNLYQILKLLDKQKFTPIICVHNDGPHFERMKSIGLNVIKVPFRDSENIDNANNLRLLFLFVTRIFPLSFRLARLIKKEKSDVVHINTNIISGIPMVIAARIMRKPVICHIRQTQKLISREKAFIGCIDRFILINHEAVALYAHDIPKEKLQVIYDGIDPDEFKKVDPIKIRKEFNLEGKSVVGIVGRVVDGKGQKEFVLAAKKIHETFPDVKFMIVGAAKGGVDGYYKEVKNFVEKENLNDVVLFTGWRNDVKDIMAVLDIVVLASTTFPEGLPNTIIEAMVLGKPVVATRLPGPTEIVIDQETGYLVPAGDVGTLVERVISILKNPVMAKAMGEKGHQRSLEFFNIKKTIKDFEMLYNGAFFEKQK